MNDAPPPVSEFLESIQRLTKDIRDAAITLSEREARYLVDIYYQSQRDRIRSSHQVRTLTESGEPHLVLSWLEAQRATLEQQVAKALDVYSNSLITGKWARSQVGIGPIIAAGLAANINIDRTPTVGGVWRFAGLDPTSLWIGAVKAKEIVDYAATAAGIGARGKITEEVIDKIAEVVNLRPDRLRERLVDKDGNPSRTRTDVVAAVAKRPWNGSLKRLCYLIGESFVKVSGNDNAVYGLAYKTRKERETKNNEAGKYVEQAKAALTSKNYGDDTQAKKWYESGKLPPARIHLRSHRWACKLFLSHFHEVAYFSKHGKLPPLPYIMERDPVLHTHFVEPPNAHLVPGLQEARAAVAKNGRV